MSDNNGWPGKPGVPLNPERDGWHWVCAAVGIAAPYPMLWCADGKAWDTGDGWEFYTSPRMTERTRYLGPVLTPAEVEARAADALKWRDAINDALTNWLCPIEDHETPADALQRLIRLEVDAALDPAVSQSVVDLVAKVRREALFEAHQRALLYANTSHHHGSLPVNPHECAAQVAMEIANSISGIDPDIRKAGYAFRRKVLEKAAQKAEMVIATGGPWPNIPAAIRALKGEGDG
jgi:hypothetical protein